jgi:secondary thiamine-phosphate synthase enzyme
MVKQYFISLPFFRRGYHLITNDILAQIDELPQTGLLNVFIKHTSAGLTINENADPSVRVDFETAMNKIAPEDADYYTHTFEGVDDMPAHLKSSIVGVSLTIPITNGRLNLGTWQGIYLCEFRNNGGRRKLVVTVYS